MSLKCKFLKNYQKRLSYPSLFHPLTQKWSFGVPVVQSINQRLSMEVIKYWVQNQRPKTFQGSNWGNFIFVGVAFTHKQGLCGKWHHVCAQCQHCTFMYHNLTLVK